MDDSGIIALFFERSEQAIAELRKKYDRAVRAVALNILDSEADAEECASDTYLGVWNTVPPKIPDSLKAYTLGLARNISLSRYHVNTAKKRNSFYDTALDELESCLAAPGGPEQELEGRENWEVTVQQWPLETELGRFSFTVPRKEARLCMFPEPLKFTNDELGGEGQILGIELEATCVTWLLKHDDSDLEHYSERGLQREDLSPEEQEYSRLINGSWARAMDKVTRGTLHMSDGTDFEVYGCNSADYRDGIVRNYADWYMRTIDINAVTAITVGGTRIELN